MMYITEWVQMNIENGKLPIFPDCTEFVCYSLEKYTNNLIIIAYRPNGGVTNPANFQVFSIPSDQDNSIHPNMQQISFKDGFSRLLEHFNVVVNDGNRDDIYNISCMMNTLSGCPSITVQQRFLDAYTAFVRDHTAFHNITHQILVGSACQ